jgi:hypothetical protein
MFKCGDLIKNAYESSGIGNGLTECKSVRRDAHNENMLAFSYGKRFELVDMREK